MITFHISARCYDSDVHKCTFHRKRRSEEKRVRGFSRGRSRPGCHMVEIEHGLAEVLEGVVLTSGTRHVLEGVPEVEIQPPRVYGRDGIVHPAVGVMVGHSMPDGGGTHLARCNDTHGLMHGLGCIQNGLPTGFALPPMSGTACAVYRAYGIHKALCDEYPVLLYVLQCRGFSTSVNF